MIRVYLGKYSYLTPDFQFLLRGACGKLRRRGFFRREMADMWRKSRNFTRSKRFFSKSAKDSKLVLYNPLTRRKETFSLLLGVLRAAGCFVETADRSSGLVVARQVLPYEGAAVPVAGEIRRMSFLVAPAQQTSEVCLTIYVSRQWYSSSAQAFCTEELGLATDPELYGEWFGRLDRAVPR